MSRIVFIMLVAYSAALSCKHQGNEPKGSSLNENGTGQMSSIGRDWIDKTIVAVDKVNDHVSDITVAASAAVDALLDGDAETAEARREEIREKIRSSFEQMMPIFFQLDAAFKYHAVLTEQHREGSDNPHPLVMEIGEQWQIEVFESDGTANNREVGVRRARELAKSAMNEFRRLEQVDLTRGRSIRAFPEMFNAVIRDHVAPLTFIVKFWANPDIVRIPRDMPCNIEGIENCKLEPSSRWLARRPTDTWPCTSTSQPACREEYAQVSHNLRSWLTFGRLSNQQELFAKLNNNSHPLQIKVSRDGQWTYTQADNILNISITAAQSSDDNRSKFLELIGGTIRPQCHTLTDRGNCESNNCLWDRWRSRRCYAKDASCGTYRLLEMCRQGSRGCLWAGSRCLADNLNCSNYGSGSFDRSCEQATHCVEGSYGSCLSNQLPCNRYDSISCDNVSHCRWDRRDSECR